MQKSVLFSVVISSVMVPGSLATPLDCHSALFNTNGVDPATRSNQYHPPSPKGFNVKSKLFTSSPSTRTESTRCKDPRALDL